MLKETKIIVCYHKEFDIFENDILLPLHVGKAMHPEILVNMQGDNTGDNISHKNATYCELTGMYWLWKNVDADNYGLFHYRRLLDIKGKYKGGAEPTEIDLSDFNGEAFNNEMENYDIILPEKIDLKMSVYEQYNKCHYVKDFDTVIKLIEDKYPEYNEAIEKTLKSKTGYFYNMFVMKKELYNEYCSWLFDILDSAEKIIDITDYNSCQKRVLGYLSERMFNIFIEYKLQTSPELRVKEVKTLFINPTPLKKINFIVGKYIKNADRTYFEIFKIKFSKKNRG